MVALTLLISAVASGVVYGYCPVMHDQN